MRDEQIEALTSWAKRVEADGLPHIVLPSGDITISACAEKLFGLIEPTKRLFMRGGAVMVLVKRDDGLLALDVLRPAAARSFFEKFARLFAWRSGADSGPVLKPVTCAQEMADALLQSEEAAKLLPHVEGLINCPVIREADGQLVVMGRGYDDRTRLLVTGGKKPPVVPLVEAVPALLDLFAEFNFQSGGDKARAVASLISPALKLGGFLKGRVPADVAEADQSQSGKTYRQKLFAAVYNERLSLVTCKSGGVGSIDESLSQQLIGGHPFVQLDNFRGRLDSPHLEALLTADGAFPCRVPHRGEIQVNPNHYFILLTSNGVETTRDFANRSNIIRIRKRAGFQFKTFPEGDLLEHVRQNQGYYLGCVFAVIEEWFGRGKSRTNETRHDFREWVQVSDWIVQNVFGLVAIMDGHEQAQVRVSNPALVWLRRLVLAANEAAQLNQAMTATEIHVLCEDAGIEVPGLRAGSDEDPGKKVIGSVMRKLFGEKDVVEVEGFTVTREEKYVNREPVSSGGPFKSKTYTITRTS